MALESPVILSTFRARIVFGFVALLAASAGLGVLSSQWDLDSADQQEFPAMRAPIQEKTPSRHDSNPLPASPSHATGQDTSKSGSA